MSRALLAKELRALRPMAWCIGGLWLIMVILQLATELPDAVPSSVNTNAPPIVPVLDRMILPVLATMVLALPSVSRPL